MTNLLNKSSLRKLLREQRKGLSLNQVQTTSKIIVEKIIAHPAFLSSKKIALYLPHENEVDLSELILHACKLNKIIYLPVIQKNRLEFYLINENTQFVKNKFGIDEPVILNQLPISPAELNLILIPLVAFDLENNRLGRGAGYYDDVLQFTKNNSDEKNEKKPVLMGVAYEFQKAEKIDAEVWDVKMDFIITEKS